jgi:radical SAM superfamily enzyme YgiQ (UPF0313 family)
MAPGGFVRHFPEHLGTAYLRAILRRARISSRQYLPEKNPGLSGFAGFLRELRPRVVGFTVYESNLNVSRAMVGAAREALPGSTILVGGPNATFSPEDTLDLVEADGCLRGAAEGTIVSLVDRILGSTRAPVGLADLLRDVPNLVVRTPDGLHQTPRGDLSSFPSAYFRTLDDIPSPFQDGVVSTPDIGYLSARGCNQRCTYCSFAAISGRRVAFHGVDRVLDDLEALEELADRTPPRYPEIQICDDAFTLVPDRARRICEGLIERGIRLPLRCETRGDRVSPELLRLMRRAGFLGIGFGLESAVPRVLRTIGKVRAPDAPGDRLFGAEREYLERFREAVAAARRCGLSVSVSVIGGLPGEKPADFRATLDFVSSLGVEVYAHNVLGLFPGTPLHEQRRDFGLDAFREPRTAVWRTVHSYAVEKVTPLRNASLFRVRWMEAERLSDALCGRPGEPDTAEDSAEAVVVHGHPRSAKLAGWLRGVLAINGSIVVFARSRSDVTKWKAFLTCSRVPFGSLSGLVPGRRGRESTFDVLGPFGEHHLRFVRACTPEAANAPVEADAAGACRVSIWVASAPGARIGGGMKGGFPLIGPGLQIADSCRLWKTACRRQSPRVLHVDSKGGVRACWHGPVIGAVGDEWAEMVGKGSRLARGGASRRENEPPRCSLPPPGWLNEDVYSGLWDVDLASQLGWMFPPGSGAGGGAETAMAKRSLV